MPEKSRSRSSTGQGSPRGHESGLRALLGRWVNQEADQGRAKRRESRSAGPVPISEAPDRERVRVEGALRTVTLRPRGGVPALEVELEDDSGSILLVWLGRRRIGGIEPGRVLRVEGRIGVQEGRRVMYNPRYEIRPR